MNPVVPHYRCSLAVLATEGDLILLAAGGARYGAALAERLDDHFVADARALWVRLFGPADPAAAPDAPVAAGKGKSRAPAAPDPAEANLTAQRAAADGGAGEFTAAQRAAIKALVPFASRARKAARRTFKGAAHATLLHDEFRVNANPPGDYDGIIRENRLLLDACRNPAHAPALKTRGGRIETDNVRLEAAIAALEQARGGSAAAHGAAAGSVDDVTLAANDLYDRLLTLQGAADNEFPAEQAGTREARLAFRLGLFPPRSRPAAKKTPPMPPAPGPAPTSGGQP